MIDLESGQRVPATRGPDETFPPGQLTADRKTGLWKAIGNAAITNALSGEQTRKLDGPIEGLPICNAFSADGGRVILGTGKAELFKRNPEAPGGVYVYEVATGKQLAAMTGHPREVQRVAFSADATRALSLDASKTLFLWAIPK
jgi:WD40 repeat protein